LDRLRQIREHTGYSQQDLADESGVGQHTISEIELGRRKPQGRTLRKLAKVLGVEVRDFFEEKANPLGAALLSLDPADLEAWISRVQSIPELKRAAQSLWPRYAQLAGPVGHPIPDEDAESLYDVGRKLDIISGRIKDLAPPPLATITERKGFPPLIIYHDGATPEVRARLRREYPDAEEIEVREPVLVY